MRRDRLLASGCGHTASRSASAISEVLRYLRSLVTPLAAFQDFRRERLLCLRAALLVLKELNAEHNGMSAGVVLDHFYFDAC